LQATLDNGTEFKFTQPFSQIPMATPVIRVRIGDLIRSNYSRFNLKRLFGFQDTEKKQSDGQVAVQFYLAPNFYSLADNSKQVRIEEDTPLGATYPKFTPGISNTVISSRGLIQYTEKEIKRRSHYAAPDENTTDFYNPAENSVVRSFESAMGMGLAAVVTSLNFTWMDALWGVGEDGSGNRAPRSCKVQMSFEPIHDIAPGLDHEGFNRAPIYPVGNLVNGIIEGGEQEPYGPGTQRRSEAASKNTADKQIYEQAIKPNTFKKLF
jgi:hypothetical protein